MSDENLIDPAAMDSMSVAPPKSGKSSQADAAGQGNRSEIDDRAAREPDNSDALLDVGVKDSMDASDPPASTQPVHSTDPAPSSGYDEEAERNR